jgi:ketosteroid isomerase-like protein
LRLIAWGGALLGGRIKSRPCVTTRLPFRWARLLPLCLFLSAIASNGFAAPADTRGSVPSASMVEGWVREWVSAYTSHDVDAIVRLDPPAPGFGYRDLQMRAINRPVREALKAFFGNMDYYRIELNEIHTAVDGDVGLAWGFFTEDFRQKGRSPERLRVRFTQTLKYEPNGWRTLIFHRDVQPFDQQGKYLRP